MLMIPSKPYFEPTFNPFFKSTLVNLKKNPLLKLKSNHVVHRLFIGELRLPSIWQTNLE